ncbi:glycosyltransferase 87 family protein [Streptomyces tagetis]|uniref:glycosyltransferase 87 family protein n=1 Tax=Streptomyces tagetis TaxID=2820809 RepID=UPI0027DB78D3|nr:glycosyltransferase 87 family protein [Streptomyces sp. RG38]
MRTTNALRSWVPLAAVWAVTRLALLLFVLGVWDFPGPDVTSDVSVIYRDWHHVLRTGTFPAHDVTWQYPPGAAFAVLSPDLLPFLDYPTAFYVLACAADLAVLVLLGYAARRPGRSWAGAWVWVAGVPLLGPTVYARYDVMVTAVAVAALLAAGRHPRAAGALAGFGAMLKVWPALLLVGVRRRGAWLAAALAAASVAAVFSAAMPGAFAFLRFQRDRGMEVESLGALVLHVVRHAGWEGEVRLHYGSVEFLGPYVGVLSAVSLALTGAAFGWLLLWRLAASRFSARTAADAAFVAVLMFTVTSRVLSPQYLVWLIGLAAVCRCHRAGRMRVPVALVLAASLVTVLEFPVWFADVVASDPRGVTLLFVRNGLLVAAALTAARVLWRDTVRRTGPARTEPERAGEAPATP